MTTSDTMKENPSSDTATSEGATPRPWAAHFGAHGDPKIVTDLERPSFSLVAQFSTEPNDYGRANVLLAVEAVNAYDRLRGALAEVLAIVEETSGSLASLDRAAVERIVRESLR